jgi:multiple sugar transport system substrate-binding protein
MSGVAQYDGLTWDHPRGFEPLNAAAQNLESQEADLRIRWHKQTLEGFESHPIADLANLYDLVIIDHPCLGEVAEEECFIPIDNLFSKEECELWHKTSVGPSYSSYHYAGKQWALPLDAATQVCVVNPEIIEKDLWPHTWCDVLDLSDRYSISLSLAGPHALLSFFSICAGIAGEENQPEQDDIFEDDICLRGYEVLMAIYKKADKNHMNSNPIAMLDCMASCREIALCPLIYGYVNYASQTKTSKYEQLAFINAPRFEERLKPRSTVGGTGLAVSRKTKVTPPLLDHIRHLMSPAYQVDFSPKHGGQPSSVKAWGDPAVNARANGFYGNTLETMSNGWVRPRYKGYVKFQAEGSDFLRNALSVGISPRVVIRKIKAMFNESRMLHLASEEGSYV